MCLRVLCIVTLLTIKINMERGKVLEKYCKRITRAVKSRWHVTVPKSDPNKWSCKRHHRHAFTGIARISRYLLTWRHWHELRTRLSATYLNFRTHYWTHPEYPRISWNWLSALRLCFSLIWILLHSVMEHDSPSKNLCRTLLK